MARDGVAEFGLPIRADDLHVFHHAAVFVAEEMAVQHVFPGEVLEFAGELHAGIGCRTGRGIGAVGGIAAGHGQAYRIPPDPGFRQGDGDLIRGFHLAGIAVAGQLEGIDVDVERMGQRGIVGHRPVFGGAEDHGLAGAAGAITVAVDGEPVGLYARGRAFHAESHGRAIDRGARVEVSEERRHRWPAPFGIVFAEGRIFDGGFRETRHFGRGTFDHDREQGRRHSFGRNRATAAAFQQVHQLVAQTAGTGAQGFGALVEFLPDILLHPADHLMHHVVRARNHRCLHQEISAVAGREGDVLHHLRRRGQVDFGAKLFGGRAQRRRGGVGVERLAQVVDVGETDAVLGDLPPGHTVRKRQLQLSPGLHGGVDETPALGFARLHADHRRALAVDQEGRRVGREVVGIVEIHVRPDLLEHQHFFEIALAAARHAVIGVQPVVERTFDDERASHAVQDLLGGRAVFVRVVPVGAFGLVPGDGVDVVPVVADFGGAMRVHVGLDAFGAFGQKRQQHVIRMFLRRNVGAVEMQVGSVVTVETIGRDLADKLAIGELDRVGGAVGFGRFDHTLGVAFVGIARIVLVRQAIEEIEFETGAVGFARSRTFAHPHGGTREGVDGVAVVRVIGVDRPAGIE